jgi:hypothetical protein
MNDQSQILGFRCIALFCPVLAVLAFQFVQGEPANAGASTAAVEFTALPHIPEGYGIQSQELQTFQAVPSPFWFEEIKHLDPVMPQYSRPAAPLDVPDPIFTLSAVLPSTPKSFAVINGKTHSEGDEIEPGWKLVKIAGQDRYIIMEHSTGRRVRVRMNTN